MKRRLFFLSPVSVLPALAMPVRAAPAPLQVVLSDTSVARYKEPEIARALAGARVVFGDYRDEHGRLIHGIRVHLP